jgi:hypothetical protein
LEQRQKQPGRRNFGVHEEALLEALREKLRELQSLKKSDNRFARVAVQ